MRQNTRAPRGLDPEKIVTSALAVADAEGLDAVTIRRLAQEHQVTPMALYRHFTDKDDLLNALADRLLADVVLPEPDERPWHEQMRSVLAAFLDALRPHPSVARLTLPRILTSTPGLALAERCLALLREGGFDVPQAAEVGRQSICALVALVTAEPRVDPQPDQESPEEAISARRATISGLPARRYPNVVAAADTLAYCTDPAHYYRVGLDLAVAAMRGISPTAVV
ncbi:TetR/AcrR family transcriptional regulator [Micromonospora sp. NPDC051006]|uniref:TetR/AcrR family transcriptional regulator n=1 Tax=Micromonospora sp. NPDC051006 TaxID=3364283 RepID=UPI00378A3D20